MFALVAALGVREGMVTGAGRSLWSAQEARAALWQAKWEVLLPIVVRAPVAWQPDGHEIEKVIEVPLAALRDLANLRVEYRERGGVRHEVLFWDYQGETIWGATARILKQYLDVLADG